MELFYVMYSCQSKNLRYINNFTLVYIYLLFKEKYKLKKTPKFFNLLHFNASEN